ncbi:hypothetical protein ABBQ32_008065 [Trebouxia sp. C0010 RCD-2024]
MTGVLGIQFDSHKEQLEKAKHQEAKEAEGDDLQLHLTLPEGREETIAAKLGQTVQYTKAVLHERFDVPIDKQTLLFEGRPMLDPLSLADCKGITCGGHNLITVQVSN